MLFRSQPMKPLEVSAQLVMRGFQSPFDELGPEPLAWRAALMLQQSLVIDDQREGIKGSMETN